MKRTAVLIAAACSMAIGANANIITVSTPSGAVEPGTGLPVDASATFTTGTGTVTVTLNNLLANPTSVAQLISDISFGLTSGQTSGTLASSVGTDRTVNGNGSFLDGSTGTRTGWQIDTGLHLTALGGGQPTELIIGPPDGSGNYSAANGSIAGNGPHNPFTGLSATFVINVPGVNVDSSVNDIVFSFGTTAGDNVPVNPPRGVPDGGTTVLLLGAALSGLGLIRRKLS